jgi:hypothetical protein
VYTAEVAVVGCDLLVEEELGVAIISLFEDGDAGVIARGFNRKSDQRPRSPGSLAK